MAENLETMLVKLDANVEEFRRELRDAGKVSDTMSKRISRSLDKVGVSVKQLGSVLGRATKNIALFGTAAAAAAVIGAGVLASRSIDAIDNVAKLSSRLGIATETLFRFQHIANLSGIEFRTFSTALQRSQRRLADAAKGNATLSKAFSELGLSVNGLLRMDPEERFFQIGEALNNVSDKSERLRLAFQLFDTEGVAVLQAMENGADGLRAMAQEADALGLTMSADVVKGVEEASDSMDRLKALFTGVVNQLTAALAPALRVFVDLVRNKLQSAIEKSGGSVQAWAKGVALDILHMVGQITVAIEAFAFKLVRVFAKIQKFRGEAITPLLELQSDIHSVFESIINQISIMGVQIKEGLEVDGVPFSGKDNSEKEAEQASNGLSVSFEQGALKAGNSIRASFEQLSLDVRNPIKSIGESIENTFIGAANTIFSEIVGNLLQDVTSSLFKNIGIGGLLGFAGGGTVSAPAIVNERGTESLKSGKGLFIPMGGPATIANASDTKGRSGGSPVVMNQTNNFDLVPEPTIDAMIDRKMPQVVELAAMAVANMQARGV